MAGLGSVFSEGAGPLVVAAQLPSRLGGGLAHLSDLVTKSARVKSHGRHRRTRRRMGRAGARTAPKEDVTNDLPAGNGVVASSR